MAGNQKFTLTFDAQLNIGQMKGAISNIQSELNKLQLPQNLSKGLTNTLNSLEKEIRNFEVIAGKDLGEKNNFKAFEHSAERIQSLFHNLQIQAKDLGNVDISKFFPTQVVDNINKANDAIKVYKKSISDLNTAEKKAATNLSTAQNRESVLKQQLDAAKTSLQELENKWNSTLDTMFAKVGMQRPQIIDEKTISELTQKLELAYAVVKKIQEEYANINTPQANALKLEAAQQQKELEGLRAALQQFVADIPNAQKAVNGLQKSYDNAVIKVKELELALTKAQSANTTGQAEAIKKLFQEISAAGVDISNFPQTLEGAKAALDAYAQAAGGEAVAALQRFRESINQNSSAISKNTNDVRDNVNAYKQYDAQMREVGALKSRIQYFFGLVNSINLAKRAIRGAIETIKGLDKAMTETAVVTDFTVSDMWSQLPEYTKRANELGVTTQAAYEAATLYYQQGLSTNEVNALSVETLKMARIAGLEAAEATDRMTNALRGFNMELTEANAQRVDDVYSELAANTASNVDEISTAMTKVASLAHNANMEFETTAAFLAQIIETTRESAETAGTALKTVVARFSEVKKLYSEDQLKGTDEEGQGIDVNKISTALRTAGIDLNKYFLGEVGLDDIFIELASKWNTLTSVQQRYIATQAAGSRQQSRFIALMQDYARTQELVGKAYSSNGAAARQFEKTQESLESKLARLKNAWNEFLMGLTNNVLVKSVVDILTTLLNIVNKLSGAFGDGASFILKWTAAIAALSGLKALFRGGGLVDLALMGGLQATGKGGLANAAVRSGLLSGLVRTGNDVGVAPILSGAAKETATAAAANGVGGRQGSIILGGTGGLFKKAWGGAQKLGQNVAKTQVGDDLISLLSGFKVVPGNGMALSSTAAGLTGIATALSAIAVAAGVAYGAYKLWLNLTPEGQLKQAKQYAKAMDDIAKNAQNRADTFKQIQSTYNEKTENINNAESVDERTQAIQDRNEYITSLLQEDATYAEYIKSVVDESGQFILTLDEDALANAVNKIGEVAKNAEMSRLLLNANVAHAQGRVFKSDAEALSQFNYVGNAETNGKILELEAQAAMFEQSAKNQISAAALQMIDTTELESGMANVLADIYAETFDSDEYRNQLKKKSGVGQFLGRDFWGQISGANIREYEALYGVGSATGKKANEIAQAIAANELQTQEQKKINDATKLINEGAYDDIFKAIAGEIDFSEEQLYSDKVTEQLRELAEVFGKEAEDLQKQVKSGQAARKAIKKGRQTDIFEQALKSGHGINKDFFDTIKSLDFEQLGVVSDIINQAAGKVSEQTFQSLFDSLPNMTNEALQQLQSFFDSFSLDNPIQALDQLNNKINEVGASSDFGKLLLDIKETNSALFESSNLVQSFLLSESYENLSDSIEQFTKDNKKLNAKNIEEMAESCKELDTLLKEVNEDLGENTNSAQALAEALNLIADGSLGIDQITDSLLAALGAGESFETLIGNIQQWIEDFDKGTDLTEGVDHITSVAKDALELVEGWQFGNEPLMNIYDHLFGNGAYDAYMKENWGKKSFDQLEKEIGGEIQRISDMAENEGLGALQFLSDKGIGITDKGNNEFEWDLSRYKEQENPVQAAIQDVATQLGVTEDAARAFIEGWASHMWDLRQEWNDLNFTDSMKAFSDELGNQSVITQAELDALIAKTGKTKEEIIEALEEIRGKGNIPIIVSWQDEKGGNLSGQDLIDKFNEVSEAQTVTKYNGSQRESKTDYSKFLGDIKNVSRQVQDEFGNTFDTLNFDTLTQHLTEAFKLTPAQANEVADHISEQTGQRLSKEIKVPVTLDDGTIGTETKVITATTSDSLQAGIDAAMQAANYALVAEQMADASDFSTISSKLETAIKTGADTLSSAVSSAAAGVSVTIPVYYEAQNPEVLTGQGATGGIVIGVAKGGQVNSYATGSAANRLSPGVALTGEEGPEIVWNKQKGYAYITGEHHPQFQNLKPGDRVFNAQETQKILNGSAATGGKVDSFASGGWKPDSGSGKGGGSGSSGSGANKKDDEWKNDLDWLYNLMEDIAELERDQKAIEEQYEDYLADQSKTGQDLYKLLIKQLGNLYTQLQHQQFALEKREKEMAEFMDVTNDKDEYLWYNWEDRTIEIDWDAIDQITDEEEYKHVKELIDEAEEIQDKIDDADDAIMDIQNQIQELENIWRDTYVDFEKRVYDAIVKSYQKVIDNYSELNDTLNDSNSRILDALQKEINLQRQIRDNTKTEEDIANDEARLAYLRRDTSGGNDLSALELEKSLEDKREDYSDNLIDQAINRLQEDNGAAAEQRERQIEIMQAQLDYQSENGEFNEYVKELLTAAMGADGELLTNSDLVALLKEQENWDAMSDVQKQVWDEELTGTFKEVAAFLLKQNAEENGTFYTALTKAIEGVSSAIGSYSQAMVKIGSSYAGSGGGGGGGPSNATVPKTEPQSKKYYNGMAKTSGGFEYGGVIIKKKYATGGLANSTGLAWLDGTPQEPEYVLNARQTDAFLKLADVLPSVIGNNSAETTNTFGSSTFNVAINVDKIASDYDVERMIDLVKEKLYDSGTYRNVNSLSFLR